MATTQGTVQEIVLFEQACCIQVLETNNTITYLLLWSYGPAQEDNAKNRLLHGMFLSLTRDAFLHRRTVTFSHSTGSALVTAVTIA